ncbi:effector-associated constant component EACC1 [Actinacidiphila acididurans]|uniref:Uncharacterized protein n=1 Tax=Actinacidiphila acididurans TaxID=2784346 RepID=A0ABS2TX61_9ACTN|nr:hypothetical protein [Actinacidiphila acididurans]MBM9507933.1 hypothetical protein [Actinacidiphila acididurans]
MESISLTPSDPSQARSLSEWLVAAGQVRVERVPARPAPGQQGALDVLTVLAATPSLVAAVKMLPEFIRTRRSDFRIEGTVGGEKFVLDVTNADKELTRLLALLLSRADTRD